MADTATILKSNIMVERASLTDYVLPRILSGESVEKLVVQILSVKVEPFTYGYRLMLLVCDGLWMERLWCSPILTSLLLDLIPQLKLSIVQMDKYVLAGDQIVVDEMTWLNLGCDVCFNASPLQHKATLSVGFLDKIVTHGQWVRDPVVQVLKIRKVIHESEDKERMLLDITDGQNKSYAILSTQLERSMRGALTKRCIVRLDVYKANHTSPYERSSITICALTLLNEGSIISFDWNIMTEVPTLTNGFIRRLCTADQVEKPVLKIVKVNYIFNGMTQKNYIRLLIFDGTNTCFAILPSRMNHLRGYMEQLPIVRLDMYDTRFKNINERMLVVHELTGLSLQDVDLPNQYELALRRIGLPHLY